jgi:CheY-like chemotaxis protein
MKVLIVDDNATNLKLLRAQLEAEKITVLEAARGVEALHLLEREHVDAVISDIVMPNMDGFRLCLQIRSSEKFRALPFILYTSTYSSPEDRQLAQIVGVDRYVVKPAPGRAIRDALHQAVNRSRDLVPPQLAQHDETYVLRQYNEALVQKLEEKNLELQDALNKLQAAHERILELNRELTRRLAATHEKKS